MTRSALGIALRRYRKLAGLTQAQLAERTGFDPKTISRFETSTYTPSIDAIMAFAQVLGVKTKDFFAEPDDEEEQRAYLFGVIHNAPPKDLGKLIAAVDQALAKPCAISRASFHGTHRTRAWQAGLPHNWSDR